MMTHHSRRDEQVTLNQAWQEICTAALLGTERSAGSTLRLYGDLGALMESATDAAASESTLLRRLSLLALYRHAGRQLAHVRPEPAVASPEDEVAPCTATASMRLLTLLHGEPEPLVIEWLDQCARACKRVAPAALPALLAYGRQRPEIFPHIAPVLGERGRWLAGQNPDWSYAAIVDPESRWQTGAGAERKLLLAELRRTDPGEARRLLKSTWKEESAQDRVTFLATFAVRLDGDDEAFLEQALDDRSKYVRRQAADLLARLPDSAFAQRMLTRAEDVLSLARGRRFLKANRLDLRLPETLDESMARDGLDHFPRAASGPRAAWAMAILSAVPPSHWSHRWDLTPTDLVDAARRSEWTDLLLEAWQLATVEHRLGEWALALLDAGIRTQDLLAVLLPSEREGYCLSALQRNDTAEILELIPNLPGEWSADFSRTLLRHLPRIHAASLTSGGSAWRLRTLLKPIRYRLAPEIWEEAAQLGEQCDADMRPLFADLLDTLSLRAEIRTILS